MSPDPFQIAAFPNDSGLWRLSWLGAIRPNPAVPSEPQIQVALMGIDEAALKEKKKPYNNDCLTRRVWSCWVGIGQLPLLTLGTFWRNKKRDLSVTVPKAVALEINPSSGRVISLAESHQVMGNGVMAARYWPLSPKIEHSNPDFAGSTLHVFPLGDDPSGIVVPSSVVYQSYYATSTRLAKATAAGTLNRYMNFRDSFLGEDGIAYVHLTKYGKEDDLWTLGRIVSSEPMKRSVTNMRNHFMAASVNNLPMDIRCGLPFAAPAKWKAEVRWFPSSWIDGKFRALVLNITECSAPFGFTDVSRYRDNDRRQGLNKADEDLIEAWSAGSNSADIRDLEYAFLDTEEPNQDLSAIDLEINNGRFPDLIGKRILDRPKDSQKYRSVGKGHEDDCPYEGVGTGDGTKGETSLVPGEVSEIADTGRIAPTLESFLLTLGKLREAGIAVTTRTLRGRSKWMNDQWEITYFPCFLGADRITWSYIDLQTRRVRQLAIVEACLNGRYVYFCEIERKGSNEYSTLIFSLHDASQCGENQLYVLAAETASKGGWPPKSHMPEFRIRKTRHTKNHSVEKFLTHFYTLTK